MLYLFTFVIYSQHFMHIRRFLQPTISQYFFTVTGAQRRLRNSRDIIETIDQTAQPLDDLSIHSPDKENSPPSDIMSDSEMQNGYMEEHIQDDLDENSDPNGESQEPQDTSKSIPKAEQKASIKDRLGTKNTRRHRRGTRVFDNSSRPPHYSLSPDRTRYESPRAARGSRPRSVRRQSSISASRSGRGRTPSVSRPSTRYASSISRGGRKKAPPKLAKPHQLQISSLHRPAIPIEEKARHEGLRLRHIRGLEALGYVVTMV